MIEEVTCPDCHGEGYYTDGGHDCGVDDALCQLRCPVPIQLQCELCRGEGFVKLMMREE